MKLSVKQMILCGLLSTTLVQTEALALSPDFIRATLAKLSQLSRTASGSLKQLPPSAKIVVYPTIAVPAIIAGYSVIAGFLSNTFNLWVSDGDCSNKTFTKSVTVLRTLTPGCPNSVRGWIAIPVIPPMGSVVETYDNFKWCAKKLGRTFANINETLKKNISLKTNNKNEKF